MKIKSFEVKLALFSKQLSDKNFAHFPLLRTQTVMKVCPVGTWYNEKSAQRDANTALAVVRRSQKFSPCRRPLPGGVGRPKFNQLEMVTTFTYKPSLVRIDARSFELSGNRATHKHTLTHRQDRLQYTEPQLASAQCDEVAS